MNFLLRLALQDKKLDDSSRLDVVEIEGVPDMLPSLLPSWSGYGLISTSAIIIIIIINYAKDNETVTSKTSHYVTNCDFKNVPLCNKL